MAVVAIYRNNKQLVYNADKFARRDHPVRFSNELVDSLQKNTFVSRPTARALQTMEWG